MMRRPLVSVIVPMYNHRKFIERALLSVVMQDYRPLQIIAIDDGSTDGTGIIARDFLSENMQSSILIIRKNRGAAETINEAIQISSGDYINILNSDDEFTLDRISHCVSAVQRLGKSMVFGDVEFINDINQVAEPDEYIDALRKVRQEVGSYPTLGFALMRNQLAISTGNFFFSRGLWEKIGPFRSYKYVHDWDFLLRSLYYEEPVFLSNILYKYRLHGNNSFKELAHISAYETTEVMRNFVWSMVSKLPENDRAPSPHYWPGVFEVLLERWKYHADLPPRLRRHDGLRD